jgi:type III restriction enzyme
VSPALIENPILNSPYEEPTRHFRFEDDGITDEVVEGRRPSSYFVPVPAAKKRGGQLALDAEWTKDRIEVSENINRVRERVSRWRLGGWRDVTPTTRQLLEYWTDPERDNRLFFCQVEAVETVIYITEVATKTGDAWIANLLGDEAGRYNPGLLRLAMKMATGSGKTVVMAMLIAWHTLNKVANPQDARFSDRFLVVSPGITIRDRLRVLFPSDPGNYYRLRDLVPADLEDDLGRARIVITNFHAFLLRETKAGRSARLTKTVLDPSGGDPFRETPDQMARRVCRDLGAGRNQIVVLNDEAHHCYARRPVEEPDGDAARVKLTGDEKREAEMRNEEAMVWISGIQAINAKLGVKVVYDLSATPFFLAGSGYREGKLFPWVVSDFSLTDAVECGIVKIPRVPVSDNAMLGEGVTYRNLWLRIKDKLPKKGRKSAGVDDGTGPRLPAELEGALRSLYENYEKSYARWRALALKLDSSTPPVFIVVCNNTAVSKMVFDYVAGWSKQLPDGSTVPVPGELTLFSNVENGSWTHRPNTILVDSEQLESDHAMSDEFKRLAATQIEEFKAEYRERFPSRDADELTDEDLLREVLNTVGKPGKLGEHVRCVVSVSMLTEGWDATTVTHILGVRAFGTQLLCEQVVGRGLRRRSYVVNDEGRLEPEYAEVYGVPFSFIPTAGSEGEPKPEIVPTRVRALPGREAAEIRFPLLTGYRHVLSTDEVSARFTTESRLTLSTKDVPTETDVAGIVGETDVHTLDRLRATRDQEVTFRLTRRLIQNHFRDENGNEEAYLFPRLLPIVTEWLDRGYLRCKDDTFPQLVLLHKLSDAAVARIHRAIVRTNPGSSSLQPVFRRDRDRGSSSSVDFDTTRQVYETDPGKCQVSHVVLDSGWEGKMAESLESMDEVLAYVKNDHLGFTIPYAIDGDHRSYLPDFVVRYNDGRDEPLNLVVEVSGGFRRDKAEKVATTKDLWLPAVNAHGGFGRWGFVEIRDPWDAKRFVRGHVGRAA